MLGLFPAARVLMLGCALFIMALAIRKALLWASWGPCP